MSPEALPDRRGRLGVGQLLLGVVVVATVGILGLVIRSSMLLGEMTSDVSVAQQRVTDLSNADRESLLLLQTLTDLGRGHSSTDVTIQRGLFVRQLQVAEASFPFGSAQAGEIQQVRTALRGFPWSRLDDPGRRRVTQRTAMALVAQSERRIKALYTEQEKFFYSATIRSLQAKRSSQTTLVVLVSLTSVLGVAWVFMLKRRTRSDVARAYHALVEEMTERRVAEDALRASEARFRSLVQRASDLTTVTDASGGITYMSPAVEALLGYLPDELIGESLLDQVDSADRGRVTDALTTLAAEPAGMATIEMRLVTKEGRRRSVEAICHNLLSDTDVLGIVWNGRDVTERRALEDQLTHQAFHDPLTRLPNRAQFLQDLESALHEASRDTGSVSVVLVDLDRFKNVNDTLGHTAGDELLQHTAERLRGCVLPGDTVARLGGDEFAVVLRDGVPEHAVAVGRRIVHALREPFRVGNLDVTVGASVGIAHRDGHNLAQDLLRDADIAMYAAKYAGKGRAEVFERDMREHTAERSSLQQQLARAVPLDEIEAYYQPLVDLRTGRVIAVEALARWHHKQRGLIPPAMFIPIAEESGTIDDIGGEMLHQACHTVRLWRETIPGHQDLGVMVNASVRQLTNGGLVDDVDRALRAHGLPPEALTLELTESRLLDGTEHIAHELRCLRESGIRLAVDDFGAGYSSLESLLMFDAHAVKIDRSLLDFDTAHGSSLVNAITELGRTLGLQVIAEGVESHSHLTRARAAGCDAAQGYYFAHPQPADHLSHMLTYDGVARPVPVPRLAADDTVS